MGLLQVDAICIRTFGVGFLLILQLSLPPFVLVLCLPISQCTYVHKVSVCSWWLFLSRRRSVQGISETLPSCNQEEITRKPPLVIMSLMSPVCPLGSQGRNSVMFLLTMETYWFSPVENSKIFAVAYSVPQYYQDNTSQWAEIRDADWVATKGCLTDSGRKCNPSCPSFSVLILVVFYFHDILPLSFFFHYLFLIGIINHYLEKSIVLQWFLFAII